MRRTGRNPRRYPGPEPLSEPESRWLVEEIERFRPTAIISVHAPSHVVDYDGPPEAPERLGPLDLKQIGTYPGSLGRYAGVELGLSVVTIELPSVGIMPSIAEQKKIWTDLVAWLRRYVPSRPPSRAEWVSSVPRLDGGVPGLPSPIVGPAAAGPILDPSPSPFVAGVPGNNGDEPHAEAARASPDHESEDGDEPGGDPTEPVESIAFPTCDPMGRPALPYGWL